MITISPYGSSKSSSIVKNSTKPARSARYNNCPNKIVFYQGRDAQVPHSQPVRHRSEHISTEHEMVMEEEKVEWISNISFIPFPNGTVNKTDFGGSDIASQERRVPERTGRTKT
uniref:Uncharacterized protein n=1 Tax=Strigamia maritima TaxID=126957 RepID=T1IVA1_STRMM